MDRRWCHLLSGDERALDIDAQGMPAASSGLGSPARPRRRHTQSMTTTIKVSDELRDRLKAQAGRDGLTLGAHLERLADAEDRRARLAALKSAIGEMSPDDAARHARETEDWESTELADAS